MPHTRSTRQAIGPAIRHQRPCGGGPLIGRARSCAALRLAVVWVEAPSRCTPAKNRITVANSGWHCKELIRGAFICVVTAACFFAAFVVLALFIPQDQQTIRRHIVSAIEQGVFNRQHWYGPLGTIIWPRHTLDCVLAGMMLAPPGGRMIDALSNQHILPNLAWRDARVAETLDCQSMVRAIPEFGEGYGTVQFERTDRYILGV